MPAIVNHAPRFWTPKWKPVKPIRGRSKYLGQYFDALGNRITMLRHSNPGTSPTVPKKAKAYQRSTGYGLVRFNKEARTITAECWPRHVDVSKPKAPQYPGWPITIKQEDNYGRTPHGYLPTIAVSGMTDPVIQVVDEKTDEVVYTLRIKGQTWQPKVFADGTYTVVVGDQGQRTKRFTGLVPSDEPETLEVVFDKAD